MVKKIWKIVSILILLVGGLTNSLFSEEANLFTNPGFEVDENKNGIPDGWNLMKVDNKPGDNFDAEIHMSDVAHSGKRSLYVKGKSARGYGSVHQSPIYLVPNSTNKEEKIGKPSFFYPHGTANWKIYTSKHYIFHYPPNSTRAKDMGQYLASYAGLRDETFEKSVSFLNINFKDRIDFFLYNSDEHGKQVTGRNLGFVKYNIPNHIYEIHEKPNQSPGHETAHILYTSFGTVTHSSLIGEGFAVYMNWKCGDNTFKGRLRRSVGSEEFKTLSLRDFEKNFRSFHCDFSYPLAGSFVGFLIEEGGLDRFKTFIKQTHPFEISIRQVYCRIEKRGIHYTTIEDIEKNWKNYIISHINEGVYKFSR